MHVSLTPSMGFSQAHRWGGNRSEIGRMGRGPKPPPANAITRQVVARNVAALMTAKWPHAPNITTRQKLLAKAAGVTPSSVQRIMGAQVACNIDTLDQIAEALGTTPFALLTPYAGARIAPTNGEHDASEGLLQRRRR